MNASRPIRLGAGALLAAGALAGVPAIAAATTSTCTYNTSNKNLVIDDRSGDQGLRIFRVGQQIRFEDDEALRAGDGGGVFCVIPGQFATATVDNTERIVVYRTGKNLEGGVSIDEYAGGPLAPGGTKESDGQSEVEVLIVDQGSSPTAKYTNVLAVLGTPQYDSMIVGAGGRINLGFDADVDIEPTVKPAAVYLDGREGNDDLWGTGFAAYGRADVALDINGWDGNDMLAGGAQDDDLRGDAGDDHFLSVDVPAGGPMDGVFGGDGFDTANVDAGDYTSPETEKRIIGFSVGRLKLTPGTLAA